jgi:ferritin-like protein
MAHETFHVPVETLSDHTRTLHYALSSLMEELEAVDWYYQRADGAADAELKAVILHNAHEEIEHACMVLEWLRRNDKQFDEKLRQYLFQPGSIVDREHEVEDKEGGQGLA